MVKEHSARAARRTVRPGGSRPRLRPPKGLPEVDGVGPVRSLQRIQGKLELIRSTVVVMAGALRHQSGELNGDVATVLGQHVVDALSEQMAEIELLLNDGKPAGADGDGDAE